MYSILLDFTFISNYFLGDVRLSLPGSNCASHNDPGGAAGSCCNTVKSQSIEGKDTFKKDRPFIFFISKKNDKKKANFLKFLTKKQLSEKIYDKNKFKKKLKIQSY